MIRSAEAIDALAAELPGRVTSDPSALGRYARDASHLSVAPLAAVAPRDVGDVVGVVRWARRFGIPLVARGGGTSLDGESVPPVGGVVVDLAGWRRLLELDEVDRLARVEPGMVNADLQAAVEPRGLFFPPNPGSWTTSTVGGNVATNASGPRSFRYGPVRAWVRAAEAVLGTGETIRLGGRSAKRSTGPDLLDLVVGSEGTLAIVTELTLALAPLPARRTGVVVPLDKGGPLGPLARGLARAAHLGLSAVEYLDRGCAEALAAAGRSRLPAGRPLLLLEVEAADGEEETRRLAALLATLRELGIPDDPVVFPSANELWTLRGQSGVALDRRLGARVREDVAVPLARLDELLATLERRAREAGVPLFLYAHLGQGSLHPNFALDPGRPEAEALRARVLRDALELGGTISAEHGIGRVKAPYLPEEVGATGVRLLRALKSACDPDGILNPGKLLPDDPTVGGAGARPPSGSPGGAGAGRTPTA